MLTCLTENIVNVLTLCKIIFSRYTSALFECSDRSNYYMCLSQPIRAESPDNNRTIGGTSSHLLIPTNRAARNKSTFH